ncbi:hypothetical protein [Streptomyces indicus]|uniref:MYXO-CTERM domain-containing protein n=1 Tax=Streptomyces indicus TaxID=417292 RepID=A0A1G8UHU3_9ACTN|nr:hypothetical protein [Streptomyces indicus]SDJ53426.1 hypothetical protein SAMN05421806_101868 [Streptomyces indicus]
MRIAPVFAAAALAAAGVAGAAPAHAADTAAEVSPRTVAPGGMVTISVSCPYADRGWYPDSITANSQAFAGGSVRLHKVENAAIPGVGPAYNGTARIAAGANFRSGGPDSVGTSSQWGVDGTCPGGSQWSASFTVDRGAPTHYGVQGGIGGSFTDSAQTMVTGAVLVLGALGATFYVIRRRQADPDS